VEIVNGVATRIPVTESSRISEARRTALSLAEQLGFNETKAGKVAIAVTEAATNLLKHAGGGEMVFRIFRSEQSPDRQGAEGLEFLALDKGPGIKNIGESLRDGQSTAGTAGNGLGAIARLSDAFDLYSQPGKGTALHAQFWRRFVALPGIEPVSSSSLLDLGGMSVAMDGEQFSGDGWSTKATETGVVVFLADGLGHGPLAESAAREAIRAFEKASFRPTAELLEIVHQATRSTRGAAVAVASIDARERVVRFAGIGNIAGALIGQNEVRHMVSMNGIVGHQVRVFREFTYPWREGDLMVLHSDGLSTHWDLRAYPGLTQKTCALMAGVLYRDFGRARDDATSVVVRQNAVRQSAVRGNDSLGNPEAE
jgi:anti-sigma regulatory factor (Ser/Thr protein kinase)